MPRRPTLSRRLVTAAAWPAGLALTSWNYMWRTTPMHRCEEGGSAELDAPPPLPEFLARAELQCPEDGVGPLFHRSYRTRIREARLPAEALFAAIRANPTSHSQASWSSVGTTERGAPAPTGTTWAVGAVSATAISPPTSCCPSGAP